LYVDMFCSGMELTEFGVCKGYGRLIVIVYVEWECNGIDEFREKVAEPDCFFSCIGKGDILGLCS